MSSDTDLDQTHWAPVRRRAPLPTHYYQQHFEEVLAFVEDRYAHVLSPDESALLESFRALPVDARRLYVRLVNRKGRLFDTARLRYAELGDLRPLVACLAAGGWVAPPGAEHADELLALLTRAELNRLLRPRVPGMSRSLKKGELVALAATHCDPDTLLAEAGSGRLFVQQHLDAIRFLLFLYFGRVEDSLAPFTMRDLGIVRPHDHKAAYEARFADRAEAREHWYFAVRLHALKNDPARAAALADEVPAWPEPEHAAAARDRDRLAARLGRALERDGNATQALAVYRSGESTPCVERTVRLLLASEQRDEARRFLERCLEDPRNDEEALMAEDLYARRFGGKRTSRLTDELRGAAVIELDESLSGAPERAAAAHFESHGIRAFRSENGLWRTLFGLLFWDELFTAPGAALHSPFDAVPATLMGGDFRQANRAAVDAALALLDDPPALRRRLLKTSTGHYGRPNGVFRWRRSMLDTLFAFLDHAPAAAVRAVLENLCADYRRSRYGYPDLLLIDGDGVRFVEIKTEGDRLRRTQLVRLEQLRAAGFRADVVRVQWILDPAQEYVVVDVETTGGRGERHRVTEIGAVKVRGGRIVDRFQTLLNPERAIPGNIVRLTGITPAMVADAPVFADVADAFAAFMGDAIFVAHNVEFDYGFVAGEFERLGRRFRHAKLCTCASMRKLYPGHASYSLGALCEAFGIPLRQHHRALCDAEAAAELLLLVNERRAGAAPA